jgi:small nuclear ribonucleoprotein (snRNP)-like protein
MLHETNK